MGDLSTNFSRHEFACKDGCGFDTVDADLLVLCEVTRDIAGHSIIPSSGCRCEDHNFNEGGSPVSQHLIGRGADLPVDNPEFVYEQLCRLYPDKYGFGLYVNRVHVDSRNVKARWSSV